MQTIYIEATLTEFPPLQTFIVHVIEKKHVPLKVHYVHYMPTELKK